MEKNNMIEKRALKKSLLGMLIVTGVFASLFLIQIVSANKLYCLTDGEQLPPNCVGSACRYTCDLRSGQGFCEICTTNSGYPGVNPSTCNGQKCELLSGDGGETTLPPDSRTMVIWFDSRPSDCPSGQESDVV